MTAFDYLLVMAAVMVALFSNYTIGALGRARQAERIWMTRR
jgi:hypothetical protein